MTLLDLCKLIKKNWKLVVALPIICALVCSVVIFISPKSYKATATMDVSAEVAPVGSIASSVATQKSAERGVDIKATTNANSKLITFTAEGSHPYVCINAVNNTATATFLKATQQYKDSQTKVVMKIHNASSAEDTSPSVARYALIALIVGLFAAICIIVIIDMIRGPIHSSRDIEEDYGLRKLGALKSQEHENGETDNEALVANLHFAAKDAKSICIVSAGNPELAPRACAHIAAAAAQTGMKVMLIDADLRHTSPMTTILETPGLTDDDAGLSSILADDITLENIVEQLQNGSSFIPAGIKVTSPVALLDTTTLKDVLSTVQAAFDLVILNTTSPQEHADFTYVSHACGSTVIVLTEMETSRKDFETICSQLSIADANVIGFITTA